MDTDDIFLKLPEVLKLTGLKRQTVFNLRKAGKFPQPFQLSKQSVAWKKSQIKEWIANLQVADTSKV